MTKPSKEDTKRVKEHIKVLDAVHKAQQVLMSLPPGWTPPTRMPRTDQEEIDWLRRDRDDLLQENLMLLKFARAALEKAAYYAEKAGRMADTRRKYTPDQKIEWKARAANIGSTKTGRKRSMRDLANQIAQEENLPDSAIETIRKAIK